MDSVLVFVMYQFDRRCSIAPTAGMKRVRFEDESRLYCTMLGLLPFGTATLNEYQACIAFAFQMILAMIEYTEEAISMLLVV